MPEKIAGWVFIVTSFGLICWQGSVYEELKKIESVEARSLRHQARGIGLAVVVVFVFGLWILGRATAR